MNKEKKIRVLMVKLGLDSHWRGVIVVSKALVRCGFEVIYMGNQTPEAIVSIALQEDVDVIGLSSLSGNHNVLVPKIMSLIKKNEIENVLVLLGGIIPDEDVQQLKEFGVAEIFGPGEPTEKIVDFIKNNVRGRGILT